MSELLCLSNGHGEDEIAVRILCELQQLPHSPRIWALPLVGEGYAYTKANISLIGKGKTMPSGGFVYMEGKQLWRDLRGGLLQLTSQQYRAIKSWHRQHPQGFILAVGDIVPLIFAWLTKANYALVATAKSEYYWQDEAGWLPQTSDWEHRLGSVYLPWERWLMKKSRCKAVFPRDTLTAKILKNYAIPSVDLGNPMMDGLEAEVSISALADSNPEAKFPLVVLLLPGSRSPEAEANWEIILQSLNSVISAFSNRYLLFLAAIAPSLEISAFADALSSHNWQIASPQLNSYPIDDLEASSFQQKNACLLLTQNAYAQCLQSANLAIAMAGTATEQFVGLGKPAFTISGRGPQFTPAFAEAQTRLLGASVILVVQPEQMGQEIKSLFQDPDRFYAIVENGPRRMGKPGAAKRIARYLQNIML